MFDGRKKRANKLWDKLLNPQPCPDCFLTDVTKGTLLYRGEETECLRCRHCGARWIRAGSGTDFPRYLIAYKSGDLE